MPPACWWIHDGGRGHGQHPACLPTQQGQRGGQRAQHQLHALLDECQHRGDGFRILRQHAQGRRGGQRKPVKHDSLSAQPAHDASQQAGVGRVAADQADPVGPEFRAQLLRRSVEGGPSASRCAPSSALRTLAARLAERAGAPDAYAQADDIWQALRQREFIVAALTQERLIGTDVPDPRQWQESLNLWRTLPPLMMHARMLARAGRTARSATAIPDTLRRIADAEERCADAAFPALPC
jgi:hypothetical protein